MNEEARYLPGMIATYTCLEKSVAPPSVRAIRPQEHDIVSR